MSRVSRLGMANVLLPSLIAVAAAGCMSGQPTVTLQSIRIQLAHAEHESRSPRESAVESGETQRDSLDAVLGGEPLELAGLFLDDSDWSFDVPTLVDLGDAADRQTNVLNRVPLPGFWETVERDLRDWPAVFWEDARDVFGNRQNLVVLGVTYGAALGMQKFGPDDTVEESFRTHSGFKDDFRDALAALGNPGAHFGLAGLWYLVGQQTQDEKTYNVANKLFRAIALNGVVTLLGQAASWDDAPNGEWGTIPSGHTSSTFALAAVLHHEYGAAVGIPLYGLGVGVAYSRLEDGEHYLSDVVMGGVLGLVIGHTVANDGEPPRLFGGTILPYADQASGAMGIAWAKSFR